MTTFVQFPCDVVDIIYRQKHQLEMNDVLSKLKTRQVELMSRVNNVIKNIRMYAIHLGFDIIDEVRIHRCLYELGILPKSEFKQLMINLEVIYTGYGFIYEDIHNTYDIELWLGNTPANEHQNISNTHVFKIRNMKDDKSIHMLLKKYEKEIQDNLSDMLQYCYEENNMYTYEYDDYFMTYDIGMGIPVPFSELTSHDNEHRHDKLDSMY